MGTPRPILPPLLCPSILCAQLSYDEGYYRTQRTRTELFISVGDYPILLHGIMDVTKCKYQVSLRSPRVRHLFFMNMSSALAFFLRIIGWAGTVPGRPPGPRGGRGGRPAPAGGLAKDGEATTPPGRTAVPSWEDLGRRGSRLWSLESLLLRRGALFRSEESRAPGAPSSLFRFATGADGVGTLLFTFGILAPCSPSCFSALYSRVRSRS